MKTRNLLRQQRPSPLATPARAETSLSPLTTLVVAVVLIGGVFAVYSPALNFQFILDDHRFVADPRLQSPGHVWEYFTTYVWAQVRGGPLCFYRPLFVLWLRLNFILGGSSPWAWHLLSIAKHSLVAILLGMLVWKLLRDRVAALLAGGLFALHPAQTESVAWVTVPDPLMSAAVLGTVLLYLRYQGGLSSQDQSRAAKSKRKTRQPLHGKSSGNSAAWMIAALAVCLSALMAKETAIVLPGALFGMALLLDSSKVEREDLTGRENRRFRDRLTSAFRRTMPFLGVTVIYLLLRYNALKGHLSPPTQHLPWRTMLLSCPAILWFYVKVLLWPVRSRAFADPILADAFSLRGVVLPALGVCCAATALAAGYAWAWRTARRDLPDREASGVEQALVLGTLILVLPILLALNLNALNPGDFLHGRYTYLPLTGLLLLLATGCHLAKKGRIVLLSAAGLVALAFSVLTVQQEGEWKDDLTVFTLAHQSAPNNSPVAQNLADTRVQAALALDDADRCDEAMPIFEQVIQQYPQDWFAWAGRGECLFKLNDLPGAEQSLHHAAELSHKPRVTEEWQQLRAKMGLPSAPLQ